MIKRYRDTKVLPIIETLMPEASHEEKMEASLALWKFFDGLLAHVIEKKSKQAAP
jgi:hypothetical protein